VSFVPSWFNNSFKKIKVHNSPLDKIIRIIDAISEWTGRAVSWLVLAMVLIIAYDISMRYLFRIGSGTLQELEWHLFALVFLFGAAYTLKHDAHVRVDIIYQSRWMNDRRRAYVEIVGTMLLLIPFCILIIVSSLPFVANSYAMGEGSPDAGGLPYRFLLKAAIPVGFGFLALQGVAQMLRAIVTLSQASPNRPGSKNASPANDKNKEL
jgi:TRAP-type mannitol/chloroaromatic compound transport system permease small subunit